MLEIFKTDVNSSFKANLLIEKIRNKFTDYMVTFDLEDEDRILRVKSNFNVSSI